MEKLVEVSSLKKGDKFVLPDNSNIVYTYEGKSSLNVLEIKAVNNTAFSTVYFPRYTKVIKL